ncbi:hypothetical protein ABW21_db0208547 [Orbilia brochopaga]|nr:hypothetical protein ABW21_db0208547 [Drechslerella brochopaga]
MFSNPRSLESRSSSELRFSQFEDTLSPRESRYSDRENDDEKGSQDRAAEFTQHPDLRKEEQLARDRRMEYLDRHDAEPLFATTRNEQLRNQHWNKANRAKSRLQGHTDEIVSPIMPTARSIENEPLEPVAIPLPQVDINPAWAEVFKRKQRRQRDASPEVQQAAPTIVSPVLRRRTTIAQDTLPVAAETEKKVHVRPVSIDKTPQTPKIERKRRPAPGRETSTSSITSNEPKLPTRAPARAPSPMKLLSPRTRLRQALQSDDEKSPPTFIRIKLPERPVRTADGARTPLMQKRISQLRSPDADILAGSAGKLPRDNGENRSNRLGFARRVEYEEFFMDASSTTETSSTDSVPPLPRTGKGTAGSPDANSRPRAQSAATPPIPDALPSKTPARKRSQSNLGRTGYVPPIPPAEKYGRPTTASGPYRGGPLEPTHKHVPPPTAMPAPTPAPSSSSPSVSSMLAENGSTDEQFGPMLKPAKAMPRPTFTRPLSQPVNGQPKTGRLGQPFRGHASEPVLGSAARERAREELRVSFSKSTRGEGISDRERRRQENIRREEREEARRREREAEQDRLRGPEPYRAY